MSIIEYRGVLIDPTGKVIPLVGPDEDLDFIVQKIELTGGWVTMPVADSHWAIQRREIGSWETLDSPIWVVRDAS